VTMYSKNRGFELTVAVVIFGVITAIWQLVLNSIAPEYGGPGAIAVWTREVLIVGAAGLSLANFLGHSRKARIALSFVMPGIMALVLSDAILLTHRSNFIMVGLLVLGVFSFLIWGIFGLISALLEPPITNFLQRKMNV